VAPAPVGDQFVALPLRGDTATSAGFIPAAAPAVAPRQRVGAIAFSAIT
jgi:hypothetical protein